VCHQRNLRLHVCWVIASIHAWPPYIHVCMLGQCLRTPLCIHVCPFVCTCVCVCPLQPLSSLSLSLSLHLYVWQPLSITLSAFVCVCVCPQCLCTFVYTYLITHFFCKILFFKTAHGSYLSTTFSVHFFSLFPLRPNPADRRMNTRSLLTLILVSFDTDRSMNTTGPTA